MGGVTIILAGIAACSEFDMKKIVALSTLSNLGIMFFALGVRKELCFYHLCTHAIFKALMFIRVGVMIYFYKHFQDLRSLGDLWYRFPMVGRVFIGSNLVLTGFPFLACFFRKDLILERLGKGCFFTVLGYLGMVLLTLNYSNRIVGFVSEGDSRRTMTKSRSINGWSRGAFLGGFTLMYMAIIIGGASLYLFLEEAAFFVTFKEIKSIVSLGCVARILFFSFEKQYGPAWGRLGAGEALSGQGVLKIGIGALGATLRLERSSLANFTVNSGSRGAWSVISGMYAHFFMPSTMFFI